MFLDSRFIDEPLIASDICIIGAGIAGITIALQFAEKACQVVLLESGGITPDPATQSLYAGETVGSFHEQLDESRTRYLGGSSNCWGGWCRPLDTIDFETRSWIPNSGWPVSKDKLLPYYERSHNLLELGMFDYGWHGSPSSAKDGFVLFPIEDGRLHNLIAKLSPPTRFGVVYRPQLNRASNIKVLLYANVTEIIANETAKKVTGVQVATLNGKSFTVSAKIVVLAAGGIENARLLLLSNRAQQMGLGNGNDLVGRYFMDHPRIRTTRIILREPRHYRALYDGTLSKLRHWRGKQKNKGLFTAHITPKPEIQRQMQLPNSRTRLWPRFANELSDAYFALIAIRKHLYHRSRFSFPLHKTAYELLRHLPVLIKNAPLAAMTLGDVLLDPVLERREFYLETNLEPIPNFDSRVSLSPARDRLGLNQVRVDWRLTEQDREHWLVVNKLLIEDLTKSGVISSATMPSDPGEFWPKDVVGCWHHMGTTRMHTDPAKGVVDADCRVHGIGNLYIAGSSVFPTVGSDFPTITIVALALRLSDKLEAALVCDCVTSGSRLQTSGNIA
ncbi:MAG: GMC family oxidoreductase [Alphaproteobacteria bacterium]|nr:GMC family oxidoreductase [Alphaproteobacteria bacterium]